MVWKRFRVDISSILFVFFSGKFSVNLHLHSALTGVCWYAWSADQFASANLISGGAQRAHTHTQHVHAYARVVYRGKSNKTNITLIGVESSQLVWGCSDRQEYIAVLSKFPNNNVFVSISLRKVNFIIECRREESFL